ncbi:hypothetical protein ADL15_48755 [Actinoplanes awajinensis subsp. mycoplanecinus]|uniref:Uncharacterized protein n=1 Tax=Actinoplanes awajinensis subsp. mycoplanecinus TaxID=135947 RepID=A0A101J917_9ACTN|nr:hypothetical protein ADL15_48755 [Actinoplanes awajinensis subsp. mycoplanecinus]
MLRQHRRKPPSGAARARVLAAELLDQLLAADDAGGDATDDAVSALDLSFATDTPYDVYWSVQKDSSSRRMVASLVCR